VISTGLFGLLAETLASSPLWAARRPARASLTFGPDFSAAELPPVYDRVPARASARRRYHLTYEDVLAPAPPVLRHRLLQNFHAEPDRISVDEILRRLLEYVPPPLGASSILRCQPPSLVWTSWPRRWSMDS
jgi:hypothetical protein